MVFGRNLARSAVAIRRAAASGKTAVAFRASALSLKQEALPSLSLLPSSLQFSSFTSFTSPLRDDDFSYDFTSITYPPPEVAIGEMAPSFSAPAVIDGEISSLSLDDFRGKWVVLFFYPKDFTFVCPTEIIAFSDRSKEFEALGAQVIAASTDTEEVHLAWIRTPRKQGGLGKMQIPIIADTTKIIAAKYGVLLPDQGVALRGLFLIDPDGVLQQITMNNLPVGRSVEETLRLLQAFQFTREHGEVCPANWTPGAKTMVPNPEDSMTYFASGATEAQEEEAASTSVQEITSPTDFKEAVKGKKVVVKFYAPWCGKCQQIKPYYEKLAAENSDVTFLACNTDDPQLKQLFEGLGISAMPAFVTFKKGKQAGEPIIGYKKKPLAEAVEKL